MHGFGPVAHTLMTNGLLDVVHLWVHPHFAGVGGPGDMLLSAGNNTLNWDLPGCPGYSVHRGGKSG